MEPDIDFHGYTVRPSVIDGAGRTNQFLDRIIVNDVNDCWAWDGAHNPDGYSLCSVNYAGSAGAHRVTYRLLVDDIHPGHEVDHVCRNRGCVNPAHLRPGSHAQNMRNVGANRGSASGIRGVNRDGRSGKWIVQCYKDGRNNFGGYFTNLVEAERAAVALRERLYST